MPGGTLLVARERLDEFSRFLTADQGAFARFWQFDETWSALRDNCCDKELREEAALTAFVDSYLLGFVPFKNLVTERLALKRDRFHLLLEDLRSFFSAAIARPSEELGCEAAQCLESFVRAEGPGLAACEDRKVPVPVDGKRAWVAAAKDDEAFILASGYPQQLFVDLDLYLESLEDTNWLVGAYAEAIQGVFSRDGRVDSLCFVEKRYGVRGAIAIRERIMEAVPVPSVVTLRAVGGTESNRGTRPGSASSVCLVYDLLYTGEGIRKAREGIARELGAACEHTVVLFRHEPPEEAPAQVGDVVSILTGDRGLSADDLLNAVERVEDLSPCPQEEQRDRAWLASNWGAIERAFPNRWVAVADERVVGAGTTMREAMESAKRTHPHIPAHRLHLACVSDPKRTYPAGIPA
jgi:orotate phosphoribosyltransferase